MRLKYLPSRLSADFLHRNSPSCYQSGSNLLFVALIFTGLLVFTAGHAWLGSSEVLVETAPIAAVALSGLFVLYAASAFTNSFAWGTVITYGLMLGVTYGPRPFFVTLVCLASVLGLALACRDIRLSKEDLVLGLLMALTAALVILDCDFSPFDISQRLHNSLIHRDTLYHASIAAMIKNYGVVSTGLHGLVPTPYHTFSHALMACISVLSGSSVIVVYGVAQWIFFAPMLIFSATLCVTSLVRSNSRETAMAWLFICAALAFIPWFVDRWTLVRHNPFISESYVLSIGLFFFGLTLLCRKMWGRTDVFLAIILAGFLGYAKASVGLIFVGLLGLHTVFFSSKHRLNAWMAFILASLTVVAVTHQSALALTASQVEASITIDWLDHIRRYAYLGEQIIRLQGSSSGVDQCTIRSWFLSLASLTIFFGTHFLFSWLVIFRGALKLGVTGFWGSPGLIFTTGALLSGMSIVLLFKLPDSTAYFFYNVAFYVAIPFWVAFALQDLRLITSLPVNSEPKANPPFWLHLGLLLVVTALVFPLDFYRYRHDPRFVIQKEPLIVSLMNIRKSFDTETLFKLQPEFRYENKFPDCLAKPFLYPAVSERPWIDVITEGDTCQYFPYNYSAYGISKHSNRVTVLPVLTRQMKVIDYPAKLK